MSTIFYLSGAVAALATFMVITQSRAVHALLYLIVSLLAVALCFYALGAPFVAALEVIVYAGAIMVIFVFVIMMLNLGSEAAARERRWLGRFSAWAGPAALGLVLLGELMYVLLGGGSRYTAAGMVEPKAVAEHLFGPYLLGVELAALILLAGLVGAYHLARRDSPPKQGGS